MRYLVPLFLFIFLTVPVFPGDVLNPLPAGSLHIGGFVGSRIDLCLRNRVMAQDADLLVRPFREKSDGKWGFRNDFWGRWYTSAMLGYTYDPDPEKYALVEAAAKSLINTQSPDGYIGTYPEEYRLGDWDVWGTKRVLLGLIANYELTKDKNVLDAAQKAADYLINEVTNEGVNLAATGWNGWKGLPPSSVLNPIARLYGITGKKSYLDFAGSIIESWNSPNSLTPTGLHLIKQALSDVPLQEMGGAPKAYEMMECFMGIAEMYRITANPQYLDACKHLINSIIREELMIVGSASIAEIWCQGRMRQNEPVFQGMETCVTVSWMELLFQMLCITGDSRYADQLETSLYNAVLGAMTPKGDWWAYYSGLMGERVLTHQQFPDMMMSCCLASGPNGLMLTPSWSVMSSSRGIALNFYGNVSAKIKTPAGKNASLKMESDYPVGGKINIILTLPEKEEFTIDLRIPEWSKNTSVKINGKTYQGDIIAGAYVSIRRQWTDQDQIELVMDMRARVVKAPSGIGDAAIRRGPVVLSFDSRLVPFQTYVEVPPMYRFIFSAYNPDDYINVELLENAENPGIWMIFNVPLLDEAGNQHFLKMCDYASAGNTWQQGNIFRVWVHQPFDLRHLYINKLDWRVTNPFSETGEPPSIPERYKK
jgi:uncharacterized protein